MKIFSNSEPAVPFLTPSISSEFLGYGPYLYSYSGPKIIWTHFEHMIFIASDTKYHFFFYYHLFPRFKTRLYNFKLKRVLFCLKYCSLVLFLSAILFHILCNTITFFFFKCPYLFGASVHLTNTNGTSGHV